jgi:GSH-dependent disulfide-bond oxidoreductase
LFWQMGAAPYLGGGFGHFFAYANEKQEYPINRFTMEVKRQLDLLDKQLAQREYIAGDEYTIADMSIWPWYGGVVSGSVYGSAGAAEFLQAHEYKHLLRWQQKIAQRPAVQRGKQVNTQAMKERHSATDFV